MGSTASVAKPRALPLALRGAVDLGLGTPALHQQPAQRDESHADCGLLPVVAQTRQADVHALARQQRAHRHRHVDDDAANPIGPDEW